MSDEYKDYAYIWFIMCVTIIWASIWFNKWFPDSDKYLLLVEFFRGNIAATDLIPPFCYRPLGPLIVALLPFDVRIGFAVMNIPFLLVLGPILYCIAREVRVTRLAACMVSVVAMVSHPVLSYGTAALVDTPCITLMALSVLLYMRNDGKWPLALLIAVLFKEVTILLALGFLFVAAVRPYSFANRIELAVAWLTWGLAVVFHLMIRMLMAPFVNATWLWSFHLTNFDPRLLGTILMFVLGFGPFIIPIAVYIITGKRSPIDTGYINRFLLCVGFALSLLVWYSLFFAYFDTRFIWPLFMIMVIPASLGTDVILDWMTERLKWYDLRSDLG